VLVSDKALTSDEADSLPEYQPEHHRDEGTSAQATVADSATVGEGDAVLVEVPAPETESRGSGSESSLIMITNDDLATAPAASVPTVELSSVVPEVTVEVPSEVIESSASAPSVSAEASQVLEQANAALRHTKMIEERAEVPLGVDERMERLVSMGFANRELNQHLLDTHDGKLEAVIATLVNYAS